MTQGMNQGSQLEAPYAAHFQAICNRFTRALATSGHDSVLVYSGAAPEVFADDQSYPFRVHATFKSWLPLTHVPDCFIWFEPGRIPRLLFASATDFWHKAAQVPATYWSHHFDIEPVADRTRARALLPPDLGRTAFLGEFFAGLEAWGVGAVNPPKLVATLDYERAVKTAYELECLRAASRLGVRGHLAAARAFHEGGSEFQIELAFLEACGLREQELPYNPIIALNEGAAVLHYQVLERHAPQRRSSLLIDAGAEFGGYASDITRCYSYADGDFAALIGRMDEMQQSLCASVHAGVDWRDIHLSAHRLTGELLHEADIIHCDADEAVDTSLTSVFLPHGIGHLLGLQVHDVGGLMLAPEGGEIPRPDGHSHLRLTRILEAGFVVTMEPGIYFIDQLLAAAQAAPNGQRINWPRVEQLRPFGGIRIEDDLAVTATGCENLTRDGFNGLRPGFNGVAEDRDPV